MLHLLCSTAAKALAAPVETNLTILLTEYGGGGPVGLLEQLQQLSENLAHYQLLCDPPIGEGGLGDPRVLSSCAADSLTSVLMEIAELEASNVELKSSFQVDRKRQLADPGRALLDYKSELVLGSALKTLAAFANTNGGTLYLGVEDSGTICGMKDDFALAHAHRADFDGWDQAFRSLVKARFSEGSSVIAYLSTVCFTDENGLPFVRVRVAKRRRLTFLKTGDSWGLFIRTGIQTNSVPYSEIENHFELIRRY